MKIKEMKCENCGQVSEIEQTRSFLLSKNISFLGFPKMVCPKCHHKNTYPLEKGYRIFYIIVIAFGALILLFTIGTGETFTPGFLLIVAIIALCYDNKIRKKILGNKHEEKEDNFQDDNNSLIYCHKCGSKIDADSKFCIQCGIKRN